MRSKTPSTEWAEMRRGTTLPPGHHVLGDGVGDLPGDTFVLCPPGPVSDVPAGSVGQRRGLWERPARKLLGVYLSCESLLALSHPAPCHALHPALPPPGPPCSRRLPTWLSQPLGVLGGLRSVCVWFCHWCPPRTELQDASNGGSSTPAGGTNQFGCS